MQKTRMEIWRRWLAEREGLRGAGWTRVSRYMIGFALDDAGDVEISKVW